MLLVNTKGQQECVAAPVPPGDTAPAPVDVEQEDEHYQPPPAKSIDELLQSDKDDEALQKYKAALLGSAVAGSGAVVVDPADKTSVVCLDCSPSPARR